MLPVNRPDTLLMAYTKRHLLKTQLSIQNTVVDVTHGSGDRVQSFMQEHTDDITALAVTPCRKWVATGEAGANPKVRMYIGL